MNSAFDSSRSNFSIAPLTPFAFGKEMRVPSSAPAQMDRDQRTLRDLPACGVEDAEYNRPSSHGGGLDHPEISSDSASSSGGGLGTAASFLFGGEGSTGGASPHNQSPDNSAARNIDSPPHEQAGVENGLHASTNGDSVPSLRAPSPLHLHEAQVRSNTESTDPPNFDVCSASVNRLPSSQTAQEGLANSQLDRDAN